MAFRQILPLPAVPHPNEGSLKKGSCNVIVSSPAFFLLPRVVGLYLKPQKQHKAHCARRYCAIPIALRSMHEPNVAYPSAKKKVLSPSPPQCAKPASRISPVSDGLARSARRGTTGCSASSLITGLGCTRRTSRSPGAGWTALSSSPLAADRARARLSPPPHPLLSPSFSQARRRDPSPRWLAHSHGAPSASRPVRTRSRHLAPRHAVSGGVTPPLSLRRGRRYITPSTYLAIQRAIRACMSTAEADGGSGAVDGAAGDDSDGEGGGSASTAAAPAAESVALPRDLAAQLLSAVEQHSWATAWRERARERATQMRLMCHPTASHSRHRRCRWSRGTMCA